MGYIKRLAQKMYTNYMEVFLETTVRNAINFTMQNMYLKVNGIPRCTCGGIIKPDVVLYEEALNDFTVMQAINYIKQADVLIVAGTSLTVYPASGLIRYFRGKHLVIINRDTTDYDNMAELVIHEKLGDVFKKLKIN